MAALAICAQVEQSLPDILPDGMWSIKPNGIYLLNFDDDTKAAQALNEQQVVGDFREVTLLDWQP